MATRLEAEKALGALLGTKEAYRAVWTALMGDGTGTVIDPDNADRVFVRVHGLQNSVANIFNKSVPTNRPDLPVLIGVKREQPHLVQVLGVDWSTLPSWDGAAMLPIHGSDHEVPYGSDPVYIQKRAIVPLRASRQTVADMTLQVAGDFYPWDDGWNYFEPSDSASFAARVPGAGLSRFVTMYVDGATNLLAYVNGDTQPAGWPLGVDLIPDAPEGSVPICAVRLENGQTTIVEADIYDLRIIVSPIGGSLAPLAHALDPKGLRHTDQLDTRHLWASVACCGAQ